ncbi:hypothetical protein EYF80_065117 [Liparis tanakae]|uniref:Secreted protein n=1 Tax=Liparis tanakae TaxID=230148 RepID=A0A4Z2E7J6_9TELE|nr:hypothetical protein EYF80_065117 [Liparis tanakae]
MASSLSSSSFCLSITAMMIFLSSSVRWLRSGRSGMDGGTVGGRGPPWGPTEADIFSTTTTTTPPPPPPPPPPRRVVSADRFSPERFRATPHASARGPRGSGRRSEQCAPLMVRAASVVLVLSGCSLTPAGGSAAPSVL